MRRDRGVLLKAFAIALTVTIELVFAGHRHVLSVGREQDASREIVLWADRLLPRRSLVVCMEMSGALKAYTSRPILRWDWLEPQDGPWLTDLPRSRGYRLYALLMAHEREPAANRLPGAWRKVGERRGTILLAFDASAPAKGP